MTLNPQASFPLSHTYVVKLHRDCEPRGGRLEGRLEHVASGRSHTFHSLEELMACLLSDAASVGAASQEVSS